MSLSSSSFPSVASTRIDGFPPGLRFLTVTNPSHNERDLQHITFTVQPSSTWQTSPFKRTAIPQEATVPSLTLTDLSTEIYRVQLTTERGHFAVRTQAQHMAVELSGHQGKYCYFLRKCESSKNFDDGRTQRYPSQNRGTR
jgi:hypothetical protein